MGNKRGTATVMHSVNQEIRISRKKLRDPQNLDCMCIDRDVPFREILQRAANGDPYAIQYVLLKYRPLILSTTGKLRDLDYLYTASDLVTILESEFIMSLRTLQCIAPVCNGNTKIT